MPARSCSQPGITSPAPSRNSSGSSSQVDSNCLPVTPTKSAVRYLPVCASQPLSLTFRSLTPSFFGGEGCLVTVGGFSDLVFATTSTQGLASLTTSPSTSSD